MAVRLEHGWISSLKYILIGLAVCLLAAPAWGSTTTGSGSSHLSLIQAEGSPRPVLVPAAVLTTGLHQPLTVLLVDKASQHLYVYSYLRDGRINLIRSFPCSTGKREGDKVREGDRRTPEGIYFFTKVFRDKKVTIFGKTAFHMNYPNPFDAREGRQGNGIYLHGTNRPLGSRATNGCVVMNQPDLDYVERLIKLYDTPIIVSRRVAWTTPQALLRDRAKFKTQLRADWAGWEPVLTATARGEATLSPQRSVLLRQADQRVLLVPSALDDQILGWEALYLSGRKETVARLWLPRGGIIRTVAKRNPAPRKDPKPDIRKFIDNWVEAWTARDVKRYISHYSRKFKAYGMNFRNWRSYKRNLFAKQKSIEVRISDLDIKTRGKRALVTFRQQYSSDNHQDVGVKLMSLRFERGSWKIWRENWKPAPKMEAKR